MDLPVAVVYFLCQCHCITASSLSYRNSRALPGGRTARSAAVEQTDQPWQRPHCRMLSAHLSHQSPISQTVKANNQIFCILRNLSSKLVDSNFHFISHFLKIVKILDLFNVKIKTGDVVVHIQSKYTCIQHMTKVLSPHLPEIGIIKKHNYVGANL